MSLKQKQVREIPKIRKLTDLFLFLSLGYLNSVHLRNVVLDDGLEVAAGGRENLSLDLVSGAAFNEANDSLKFVLASELFSHRS